MSLSIWKNVRKKRGKTWMYRWLWLTDILKTSIRWPFSRTDSSTSDSSCKSWDNWADSISPLYKINRFKHFRGKAKYLTNTNMAKKLMDDNTGIICLCGNPAHKNTKNWSCSFQMLLQYWQNYGRELILVEIPLILPWDLLVQSNILSRLHGDSDQSFQLETHRKHTGIHCHLPCQLSSSSNCNNTGSHWILLSCF